MFMTKRSNEGESLTAASLVPAGGDPASMDAWAAELVARARDEGVALTGDGGLLTDLMRSVLQRGLEVEMAEHLGYERHAVEGRGSGNSRNGTYPKTVVTEIGEVEVAVPRDRNGTFEPATVPKHTRRLDGLSGNVISLYAKGMTTGDIQAHLAEIYDTDISRETISKITDEILADMVAWQNRPLEPIYAVMLIDAIVIKVRGSQVANRPVYVAIGVDLEGHRDVLGMWLGPTGGEGAKQWATMLTELRNRGVTDALIVCCDGLKGLPESIRGTWPEATVQTCVVHMVRNSLRYASKKHWAQITRQMRAVYEAPTLEAAQANFDEFAEQWRSVYPAMISAWENAWDEFVPFLDYSPEIRRVIYSTNAIESLHARYRRAVTVRGHFPTEQAALKCLYLVTRGLDPKGTGQARWTMRWKPALNAFAVTFADRMPAAENL